MSTGIFNVIPSSTLDFLESFTSVDHVHMMAIMKSQWGQDVETPGYSYKYRREKKNQFHPSVHILSMFIKNPNIKLTTCQPAQSPWSILERNLSLLQIWQHL